MTFSMIGQTHVGNKHPENQDRILLREFTPEGLYLIGVADGISQCSYGGSVARFLMEQHLPVDEIFEKSDDPLKTLEKYLNGIHRLFKKEFEDMYDMLESGASLSLALGEEDGTVHCMWCGDSPIYITEQTGEDLITRQISKPDHDHVGDLTDHFGGLTDFDIKIRTFKLKTGGIISVTSDGIENGDLLLNEKYSSFGFSDFVCSELIREMLANPHADDISITALQKL